MTVSMSMHRERLKDLLKNYYHYQIPQVTLSQDQLVLPLVEQLEDLLLLLLLLLFYYWYWFYFLSNTQNVGTDIPLVLDLHFVDLMKVTVLAS